MNETINNIVAEAVKQLFDLEVNALLTIPEDKFGDLSTNVAMKLSKQLGKSPREIADEIANKLRGNDEIAEVSVAGPGFINIKLSDKTLVELLNTPFTQSLAGKVVICEYSDPNPFKVLHAGHLYTSIVGHTIANLFEIAGAEVHRVNFGGDVGLHVGKTMWALLRDLGGENPDKLSDIPDNDRSEWMARGYISGTQAYEDDEQAKQEIIELNKRVYKLVAEKDRTSAFAQIYWTCRDWSYAYFNEFYARIGTPFEKYYPESSVAELGLKTVKEQLENGVYELSDGAVVFDGEKHGLHTRVFINSEGLPTYEAKDVGLIFTKYEDYHFDRSVVITGNEQEQYMSVVLKSVEQYAPELVSATTHLTHGIVKLAGGIKMSSRKGNFLRASDVLDVAQAAAIQANKNAEEYVSLGAVKYAFLKNRMGGDIVYDPEESVSIVGNSGPYLQYAHARARSILRKSKVESKKAESLEAGERTLVRKLTEYNGVIEKAIDELAPHVLCTYLYELAQVFNRFYEQNKVIDSDREAIRMMLVSKYADTLQAGLKILAIHAPEEM